MRALWVNVTLDKLRERRQRTEYSQSSAWEQFDPLMMSNEEIASCSDTIGSYPPSGRFLTGETRRRIADIYAEDFRRLPYDTAAV